MASTAGTFLRGRKHSDKREKLRDDLWPGMESKLWHRSKHSGFCTIPRVLPLVMHLTKLLCDNKLDPSTVYLELWARGFDESLVYVTNEQDCAYASGYTGARALRTWRERVYKLEELGFLKYKAQGNRAIAHVLLLDPLRVCAELKRDGKIPLEWWDVFVARAAEIGAVIPDVTTPPPPPPPPAVPPPPPPVAKGTT